MNEVGGMAARVFLEMANSARLPLDDLTRGLSFDARSLRGRRGERVAWDDCVTLLERMEAAVGGPERFDALSLTFHHTALPPELRAVLKALVSARALYRFWIRNWNPVVFPNHDFGYEELAGGRIRISGRLRAPARPSPTFYRSAVAALANLPCHLGLPPAETEVEELTDRSLVLVVRPPRSETVMARASRASLPAFRRAALAVMDMLAGEALFRGDQLDALLTRRSSPQGEPDILERVRGFEVEFALTPKQAQVLVLVARGSSNKEIARELEAAERTIEFHVTQLLRKVGADSRAQLIAKLWTR